MTFRNFCICIPTSNSNTRRSIVLKCPSTKTRFSLLEKVSSISQNNSKFRVDIHFPYASPIFIHFLGRSAARNLLISRKPQGERNGAGSRKICKLEHYKTYAGLERGTAWKFQQNSTSSDIISCCGKKHYCSLLKCFLAYYSSYRRQKLGGAAALN